MAVIKIDESDNNTTLDAAVGDQIELTLPVNTSTGYYWSATDTSAGTLDQVQLDPAPPKRPGAPSKVRFVFTVKQSGHFTLNYARPWGELTPPAKWYTVEIKVK